MAESKTEPLAKKETPIRKKRWFVSANKSVLATDNKEAKKIINKSLK